MDQYFNQMEKIIKEKKTSSRIRFMLQDVIDLRRVRRVACYCLGTVVCPLLVPMELLASVFLSSSSPCITGRGEVGM